MRIMETGRYREGRGLFLRLLYKRKKASAIDSRVERFLDAQSGFFGMIMFLYFAHIRNRVYCKHDFI